MEIAVDGTKCQRYGQCALEAPQVFALEDEGPSRVLADVPDSALDDALNAAELCPMQAITVEE